MLALIPVIYDFPGQFYMPGRPPLLLDRYESLSELLPRDLSFTAFLGYVDV